MIAAAAVEVKMSGLVWSSILLCLIVGVAIEKSNVCLVRGTSNLAKGRPEMVLGILLITASASLVYYALTLLALHHLPSHWAYPTGRTVAGAVVFALGSIVNGACAVGTIGRIARGDIGHLATLAGALSVGWLFPTAWLSHPAPETQRMGGLGWLEVVLAVSAGLLVVARKHVSWKRLAPYVALGTVAAVVTDWRGNWTWTTLALNLQASSEAKVLALTCIAAVLLGAALTAFLTGQFSLSRPNPRVMARELAGGGLMVAGALLIPGANDALSVYGVPSGSPDMVVAYILMFFVMFAVFRVTNRLSRAQNASLLAKIEAPSH